MYSPNDNVSNVLFSVIDKSSNCVNLDKSNDYALCKNLSQPSCAQSKMMTSMTMFLLRYQAIEHTTTSGVKIILYGCVPLV